MNKRGIGRALAALLLFAMSVASSCMLTGCLIADVHGQGSVARDSLRLADSLPVLESIVSEQADPFQAFDISDKLEETERSRFSPQDSGEGRGGGRYFEYSNGVFHLNMYHYTLKGSAHSYDTIPEYYQLILKMNFGDGYGIYYNTAAFAKLAALAYSNRSLASDGSVIVNVANSNVKPFASGDLTCLRARYYPERLTVGASKDDTIIEIAYLIPVGDYVQSGSSETQEVFDIRIRTKSINEALATRVVTELIASYTTTLCDATFALDS